MAGTIDDQVANVAEYRHGLRSYLRELEWADEWRSARFTTTEESLAHDARMMARMFEAGWNRYGWPIVAGGCGGSQIHRAVLYEELALAMLPVPAPQMALEVLGPALLKFAPKLAAMQLPNCLCGKEWLGQGFSEPESGSDLASLRTRATDDGDRGFLVNGQKIWTSNGSTATRLLALVRTGAPESRHRGLTMMLIDADAPGVSSRPIALASGRRELAEVFFDDVRVPYERVVGEVDGGWGVAMYLMQFERGTYGYALLSKIFTELSRLREDMAIRGASPSQWERFARAYVNLLSAQARTATTVRRLANGESLGADSSIDKLLFSKAEREVNDLVLDVQRHKLMAAVDSGNAEVDSARAEWWYSRAATIMGGTAEMQRGIIADHLLGLPKERR